MLLIFVEEAVEGCWGKVEGFGDEGGEACGEEGHGGYVGFKGRAEGGEDGRLGPLVGGEEVVIKGRGRSGKWMGCGKVDLFAVVGAVGGDFIAEFVVSWRRPVSAEHSCKPVEVE